MSELFKPVKYFLSGLLIRGGCRFQAPDASAFDRFVQAIEHALMSRKFFVAGDNDEQIERVERDARRVRIAAA